MMIELTSSDGRVLLRTSKISAVIELLDVEELWEDDDPDDDMEYNSIVVIGTGTHFYVKETYEQVIAKMRSAVQPDAVVNTHLEKITHGFQP